MSKFVVTERGILGVVTQIAIPGNEVHGLNGYRFVPWVQHSPSRKVWPTIEGCIPRWAKGATIVEATNAQAALAQFAASDT